MSKPDPRFTYNAHFHPRLILWMARWGLNEKQIAAELEVPSIMFEEWKASFPEVLAALDKGRRYWSELAYDSLQKLVKGYDYDETDITVDPDGKPTKVRKLTKHKPPDARAVLFQLENDPLLKMFLGKD